MLRVIRFLLFIAALMAFVYEAGAQDFSPAPFTLSRPWGDNPAIFRMDYRVGCDSPDDLTKHTLLLNWEASEWSPPETNPDTSDRVRYEVIFRLDSALADGSFTKVERSLPSDDNGQFPWLRIVADTLYEFLWTDGYPVEDRTDSLVMEIQWYVKATSVNHGLVTYSDTAGVSIESDNVKYLTKPLVVSINRPPVGPTPFIYPHDGEEFYNIENTGLLDIVWSEATDVNKTLGYEQGLFHEWNPVTTEWETVLNPGNGIPERSIDTVFYQWYGVVAEAWPKPSPVTGMALVKSSHAMNGVQLDINDLDALFQGLQNDDVDSIRIEHCVLAKDAGGYGEPTVHAIYWPYMDGVWPNGLTLTPGIDTSIHSEFGCAPHIIKGACGSFMLKKGGPTSVNASPEGAPQSITVAAYPNPFSTSTAITYNLPARGNSRLAVYDMLGREVTLLHEGHAAHGTYTVQWSPPADLPRGNYMIVLTANGQRFSTPVAIQQ